MNLVTYRNSNPASLWESVFESFPWSNFSEEASIVPRANIVDRGKSIAVSVELPGVKKENIKVEAKDNVLTVSATRKQESENKDDNVYVCEFSHGTYRRSFRLSETLDSSGVSAKYENGILELEIAKKPQAEPTQVVIQ